MKRWFSIAALVAAFVFLAPLVPHAADVPRGLGHPQGDEPHWYDASCCAMKDCEPVEQGAIQRQDEGYYVEYLSSNGLLIRGFVPIDSPAIHQSRDGREHACSVGNTVLCIYLPLNT